MWLCDNLYWDYATADRYGLFRCNCPPKLDGYCGWYLTEEGSNLVSVWFNAEKDAAISGVLADWLDDHRDSLLEGAVGQDPAGRLDLLIRWLREVRCWGKESVSV